MRYLVYLMCAIVAISMIWPHIVAIVWCLIFALVLSVFAYGWLIGGWFTEYTLKEKA